MQFNKTSNNSIQDFKDNSKQNVTANDIAHMQVQQTEETTDLKPYFQELKEYGFNVVPLYNFCKYSVIKSWNTIEHDYIGHKATGIVLTTGTKHDNKLFVAIDFDFKVDEETALKLIKEINPALLLSNKPYFEFTTSGGLHVPLFVEDLDKLPEVEEFKRYLNEIKTKLNIEVIGYEKQPIVIAPSIADSQKTGNRGKYTAINGNYINAIKNNTVSARSFKEYLNKLVDKAQNVASNVGVRPKYNIGRFKGCHICLEEPIEVDELTCNALDKLQTMYEGLPELQKRNEYTQLLKDLSIDFKELPPVHDENGFSSSKVYLKNLITGYEDGEPSKEDIERARATLRRITDKTIQKYKNAFLKYGCLSADPGIKNSENNARTFLAKLLLECGYSIEESLEIFSAASNYNRNTTLKFLKSAENSTNQILNYNVVFFNERRTGKATVTDLRKINMKKAKGLFYMLFKYRNTGFSNWLRIKGLYRILGEIKEELSKPKEERPINNPNSTSSDIAENILKDIRNQYIKTYDIDRYISNLEIADILKTAYETKANKIGIQAPTGSGKTTSILDYAYKNEMNIVFLVPYTTNAQQKEEEMKKLNRDCVVLYEGARKNYDKIDIQVSNMIIATYDQLPTITNILNEMNRADKYILIIDEYHNITAQQFRGKAIKGFLEHSESYDLNIYITATFEGVNVEDIDLYNITVNNPIPKAKKIELYPTAFNIAGYFYEHLKKDNPKKAIVLLDNKFQINEIVGKLAEDLGRKDIYTITADNKDSEIYRNIIENSELGKDGIYLCTRLLSDGINILDLDVETLYIVSSYNITTIRQFIARTRKGVDTIKIFYTLQNIDNTPRLESVESEINENIINYVEKLNEIAYNKSKDNINTDSEQIKNKINEVAYSELIEEEKHIYRDTLARLYKINKYSIRHSALNTAVSNALHNTEVMKKLLENLEDIPIKHNEIPEEVKEEIAKADKTAIYERLYDILNQNEWNDIKKMLDAPNIEITESIAKKLNMDLKDCLILRTNGANAYKFNDLRIWEGLGILKPEEIERLKTNENGEKERIRIFKIENKTWNMIKRRCNLAQNIMLANSKFNFEEVNHFQRGLNAQIYLKIIDYCLNKRKVSIRKLKDDLKAYSLKNEIKEIDVGMKLTEKNICKIIATIFECRKKTEKQNGKEIKVYYIYKIHEEINRVLENKTKYHKETETEKAYSVLKEYKNGLITHYDLKEELKEINIKDIDKTIQEMIQNGKLERPKPGLFKIA